MNIEAYISSGIIESYVLGLASVAESEELQSKVKEYEAVQTALMAFEHILENEAIKNSVAPPPQIKKRLMKTLHIELG